MWRLCLISREIRKTSNTVKIFVIGETIGLPYITPTRMFYFHFLITYVLPNRIATYFCRINLIINLKGETNEIRCYEKRYVLGKPS